MKLITFITLFLLLCSCSTTGKSIFTGSAVGAGIGTIIGHQQKDSKKGKIIGAAAGSGIGGLIGYLAKKKKDKKIKSKKVNYKKNEVPHLTRPKVRMYWQPDQIIGNKYIEAHKVWVLESAPTWTR